jgi:hypothetical protein
MQNGSHWHSEAQPLREQVHVALGGTKNAEASGTGGTIAIAVECEHRISHASTRTNAYAPDPSETEGIRLELQQARHVRRHTHEFYPFDFGGHGE